MNVWSSERTYGYTRYSMATDTCSINTAKCGMCINKHSICTNKCGMCTNQHDICIMCKYVMSLWAWLQDVILVVAMPNRATCIAMIDPDKAVLVDIRTKKIYRTIPKWSGMCTGDGRFGLYAPTRYIYTVIFSLTHTYTFNNKAQWRSVLLVCTLGRGPIAFSLATQFFLFH